MPKPSLNAFAMLHRLGDRRIKLENDDALATRSSDGAVEVALWNYAPPFGIGAAYTPPPTDKGADKNSRLPSPAFHQTRKLNSCDWMTTTEM
ncbi:hypothetical protein RBB80_15125 [Tunturiibacter gelidiferens]